jgi:hypothetical protein
MPLFSSHHSSRHYRQLGFTLIEVVIGATMFLFIGVAVYRAYTSIFQIASASQYKITAINLINEQFESIKNLPYDSIGNVNGIPVGVVPRTQIITRGGLTFLATTTIRNIDLPFDGTIASTTKHDSSPADNKLIEVEVACPSCFNFVPMSLTLQVAPKALETASTNGALFVKVFDANGLPVDGASVHIQNTTGTTSIIIDDVTDNNGLFQLIDVPPAVQGYYISVTKGNYSTDKTYTPGAVANPTPLKPDATVVLGSVTQTSFAIDQLANLTLRSVSPSCSPVPDIDFSLAGAKLIGTPDVKKFLHTYSTNSSGVFTKNDLEWDVYTVTNIDHSYDIAGLSVANPIQVNPGSSNTVYMVVVPHDPRSLLVTVKDAATRLPLTNSTVSIFNGFSTSTKVTGQGYSMQTDWSGGGGQVNVIDPTQFFAQDGNLDTATSGSIRLFSGASGYPSMGQLESSTFDAGTTSIFRQIIWQPEAQHSALPSGALGFQIASATTSNPAFWNFIGPDGTAGTYYTASRATINNLHSGDRYFRYKALLQTAMATVTPVLDDVSVTYTLSCTPPGQVIFSNLGSGTVTLTVSRSGYTTYTANIPLSDEWQEQEVLLTP